MSDRTKKQPKSRPSRAASVRADRIVASIAATLPGTVREIVRQELRTEIPSEAVARAEYGARSIPPGATVQGTDTCGPEARPLLAEVADQIGMAAADVHHLAAALREIADATFGGAPDKEHGNATAPKPSGRLSEVRDQQDRLFAAISALRVQVDRFRAL